MPKSTSGPTRYLKAQLRPLTRPAFWASAGLFGLSLFAVVSLLRQPEKLLGIGDPNTVVNLDGNETLTPEERARAAEIDDLSVLLKELDEGGTLESVSSRLTQKQKAQLDKPEALTAADLPPTPAPTAAPAADFEALPLLNLSPQSLNSSTGLPSTTAQGFVGLDPRSQSATVGAIGTVNGSSTASSSMSPLAAALQQYSAQSAQESGLALDGLNSTDSSNPTLVSPITNPTELGIRDTDSESLTPLNTNSINPAVSPSPTTSLPLNASGSLGLVTTPPSYPENYSNLPSNNAYTQLLNPNLVIPSSTAAPTSATTAPNSPTAPALGGVLPAAPALTSPTTSSASSTISLPTATPSQFTTQTSSPSLPQLSSNQADAVPIPVQAPFSVPNQPPAQYTGNGQINTFANP